MYTLIPEGLRPGRQRSMPRHTTVGQPYIRLAYASGIRRPLYSTKDNHLPTPYCGVSSVRQYSFVKVLRADVFKSSECAAQPSLCPPARAADAGAKTLDLPLLLIQRKESVCGTK